MRRYRVVLSILALALIAAGVVFIPRWLPTHLWPTARTIRKVDFERYARQRFEREHPGERPLNWRIGEAAVRFYKSKPMGKFALGIKSGEWGNDCSDFVDCAIDEGLGAGARFKRGSRDHLIGADPRYFGEARWDGKSPLQPGDVLAVAHSPWYEPYEGACWHVGIIGSDGRAYDFAKLRSWPEARYGRHTVAWFVRRSSGTGEVVVGRLRPEYRYRLRKVRGGRSAAPAGPPRSRSGDRSYLLRVG